MAAMVKQICALSVLCGVAMSVAPEGSVKKLMNVLCSLVLLSCLFLGIKDVDFNIYSAQIAKYKEREAEFAQSSEKTVHDLKRTVIEQQYAAYILDKATELGLKDAEIKITSQWSTDGLWVPYSFEINCEYCSGLSEYIETELGIPAQRQHWNNE